MTEHPVLWASTGGAPVELDRLQGPRTGQIDAPAHLIGATRQRSLDLDDPQTKIRLYEVLLRRGSAFDLYHWVNLDELIAIWDQMTLPKDIAAPWAWALQSIHLERAESAPA
jgi:hypothetical protein